MRLGHKPCYGLLESNSYLPLRYAPLEVEFTIVSNEHAPVIAPVSTRDAAGDLINKTYTDRCADMLIMMTAGDAEDAS